MAATYSVDDQPAGENDSLQPGASPRAIRAALLAEDRERFDEEYSAALTEARTALDLAGLFRTLEHWRGVATMQADPERFARTARRAAEVLTGRPSPADEPLEVTRAKAQM